METWGVVESTLHQYYGDNVTRPSCLGSTHDDAEVIKQHQDQKKYFIIKRNLREDIIGHWLLLANCIGTCHTLCEGEMPII
jgi:hypothetical protein